MYMVKFMSQRNDCWVNDRSNAICGHSLTVHPI